MTAARAQSSIFKGIVLMALAYATIAGMDGVAKFLIDGYHPFQIAWGRYLFQSMFLSVVIFGINRQSPALLRTHRPAFHAARAFLSWFSNLPFIWALSFIPLADATSAALVGPLIVTALSVPLLGERVGVWRWSAVAVGMVGALIVVRPGMGVVHWAIMLPMVSATSFALYSIFTRKLSATEGMNRMMLLDAYGGLFYASLAMPFVWKTPGLADWALFAAMGLISTLARTALVNSLRFAPASITAPFSYTQIVSATLIGLLVFGDFPDKWTITGAAILCLSGIFIAIRERQRARRQA